jgi:predicted lipid-binding transport protein (Tim44 family)
MRRVLVVLLLVALAVSAFARVGGGDSYSGGGSSGGSGSGGGSGGGSGDGELAWLVIRFLFWLTIHHPVIGIPLDILVIFAVIRWRKNNAGKNVQVVRVATDEPSPRRAATIDALRQFDPNFSEITFADFCYSLYARVQEARGKGDLSRYTLYLSDAARQAIESASLSGLREVRGVVIGSFRILSLRGLDSPQVTATVLYESNYTEVSAGGEQSWYAREEWQLERKRDLLSPPPEKAKADHCPKCGAPLQTRTDGSCEYCGVRIDSGAFHWFVRSVGSIQKETRGPLLTGTVPEQGTTRGTVYQPHIQERRASFEEEHPGFNWDEFKARVTSIAVELQDAWTARDWERVRPLETESLFQMHRYWIDAYKRQDLRNLVDDFTVTRIEPVKIDSDAFYEAITVRIWAKGRDHTDDARGKVVAGSKTDLRTWTEYWTLIRSRKDASHPTMRCPNCGADVPAGATAICPYCSGKLTSGVFDWVLSRIEQDEAYGG